MISNATHLEPLVPLSGEASPAHGLQPHDLVPQPEVALLLEMGERAGAEEELKERVTKRALMRRQLTSILKNLVIYVYTNAILRLIYSRLPLRWFTRWSERLHEPSVAK